MAYFRTVSSALALASGLLLSSGCAQVPTVMHYYPEGENAAQARIWPAFPEVPRYRYAGQLIGDINFGPEKEAQPKKSTKFLRWLVGLKRSAAKPTVLMRPQSGMADQQGRIYVTDVGRQGIFVFDELQGKLLVWEQADKGMEFRSPIGITAGPGGQILVADSELGRIVRLDREGKPLGSFGTGVVQRPTGLARDPKSGVTYVADTTAHDIKVFDDEGRLVEIIGHRGRRLAEFNGPTHLAFAHGKLYVSDTLNARVQVLTVEGEALSKVGQRGLYVGNLVRPKGVTVDDDGNIYVIEGYYDHLLVFNQATQLLLPIGGTGASIGRFFLPAGVWSDPQNRIFVADMFNGRVLILQYLGN